MYFIALYFTAALYFIALCFTAALYFIAVGRLIRNVHIWKCIVKSVLFYGWECIAFVMQQLIDFISLIRITGKAIATAIEVTMEKLG